MNSGQMDVFEVKLTFEMLTMRGQQHSFSTHELVFLGKVSKFLRQKMSRPEGDSNLQPSDSCRMLQPIELSGPDICCPMLLNTGSDGVDIFEVKLTFEMLTVRGQQHSFSTHERVFLGKCQSLWDRKCLDLRRTRTSNLRIHAECSNLLRNKWIAGKWMCTVVNGIWF